MVKGILTFLGVLCLHFIVNAQEVIVSGVVSDDHGKTPLAGVTVVEKGSLRGVVTNMNGYYEISISGEEAVLSFSFIGMKTVDIPVTNSTVDVILEPDIIGMDEVVVVAYGSISKQQFVGSVSKVDAAELDRFQAIGISEVLQDLSSGVYTAGHTGQPGNIPDIRIRGFNSFGAARPLIVLDGFPYDGNLNSISVSDIESVSVLKDAISTALYGSRAANGVIIITTRRGIGRESGVNLRMSFGLSDRAIPTYEKVSAADYYVLQWEGLRNSLIAGGFDEHHASSEASARLVPMLGGYNAYNVPDDELVGVDGVFNQNAVPLWQDDWMDALTEVGKRSEISLSGSGQTEKSDIFISGTFLDEKGIIKASGIKRYSIRTNMNTQLTPIVRTGVNLTGNISEQNYPESGVASMLNPFRFAELIAPVYPVFLRDENGVVQTDAVGKRRYDYGTGYGRVRPFGPQLNPLGTITHDQRIYKNDGFSMRTYLDFGLLEGFTFKASLGADYLNYTGLTHQNMRYGDGQSFKGRSARESFRTLSYTSNQLLHYNKESGNHQLLIIAAHENYNYKFNALSAIRSGFPFPGIIELDGASVGEGSGSYEDNYRLESYMGKIDYTLNNKYLLSLNYRSDGNSRFAKDVRWGNFWGAGVGWIASGEGFLNGIEVIDLLKFKASYGEQGNDNVGTFYAHQGLYQTGVNNLEFPGLIASRLATPELTWEELKSVNIGAELIINERYSVNLEYYIRQNDQLLFEKPLPPSTGFTSIDANTARLVNSGFDFEFTGLLIHNNQFKWVADLKLNHFKNEIRALPQDFIISGNKRWEKGESIYEYWIEEFAGVHPETGKSQWYYTISDGESSDHSSARGVTTDYSAAGRYYVGSSIPDLFGSFTNSFSLYGFDISALVSFAIGGKAYDNGYVMLMHSGRYGYSFHADVLDRWTPENTNTMVPSVDGDQLGNRRSSRFLVDAGYISFRNLSVGYKIPETISSGYNLYNIRIFAKADNLYLLTARNGLNPQQDFDGSVYSGYVPVRTVSVGLDVQF